MLLLAWLDWPSRHSLLFFRPSLILGPLPSPAIYHIFSLEKILCSFCLSWFAQSYWYLQYSQQALPVNFHGAQVTPFLALWAPDFPINCRLTFLFSTVQFSGISRFIPQSVTKLTFGFVGDCCFSASIDNPVPSLTVIMLQNNNPWPSRGWNAHPRVALCINPQVIAPGCVFMCS